MSLIGEDLEWLISEKGDGHRLDHLEGRLPLFSGNMKLILTGRIFPIDREKKSDIDPADDGAMAIGRRRAVPTGGALGRFFQRCDFLVIFRGEVKCPLPRRRILQKSSKSGCRVMGDEGRERSLADTRPSTHLKIYIPKCFFRLSFSAIFGLLPPNSFAFLNDSVAPA